MDVQHRLPTALAGVPILAESPLMRASGRACCLSRPSIYQLAQSLGIDADEVIRATEQNERQLLDYSSKFPGFRGELEFDWAVGFLGQSATRKGKIVYSHMPEWEYFDLHKNAPYTGRDSSSYRVEVQAEPVQDWDRDGKPTSGTPYWVSLEDITKNDVLPNTFWEAVIDAIDAKCKVEDAERQTPRLDKPG